jgi:hypothetical protein
MTAVLHELVAVVTRNFTWQNAQLHLASSFKGSLSARPVVTWLILVTRVTFVMFQFVMLFVMLVMLLISGRLLR